LGLRLSLEIRHYGLGHSRKEYGCISKETIELFTYDTLGSGTGVQGFITDTSMKHDCDKRYGHCIITTGIRERRKEELSRNVPF